MILNTAMMQPLLLELDPQSSSSLQGRLPVFWIHASTTLSTYASAQWWWCTGMNLSESSGETLVVSSCSMWSHAALHPFLWIWKPYYGLGNSNKSHMQPCRSQLLASLGTTSSSWEGGTFSSGLRWARWQTYPPCFLFIYFNFQRRHLCPPIDLVVNNDDVVEGQV
jgi:hypothetical protein